MQGRLVVVSGPSGSGKSSILRGLSDEIEYEFSVSATTRRPRPGEVDGVHYHFVDEDDFRRLVADDKLLEWAVYNGNCYGTLVEPIDDAVGRGKKVLLDIEIQGARQIRAKRPGALMIFIEPPSLAELERRLRSRGDTSEEDIRSRLGVAASQIAEARDLFDHTVINDDLRSATKQVANLIIEAS